MTRDSHNQSRREFLRSSTTAAATASLGVSTGFAGCASLPGFDDEELSAPDYDEGATTAIVSEPFPSAPAVFPVEIPDARFQDHESRARELLAGVPEHPDIPNEAVAERIADHRSNLAERIGDLERATTPRERLGRWRYYRSDAAEVWGSFVAATDQYTPDEFRSRYDEIRSEYTAFDGAWDYRGSDPTEALIVHHAIERLVSHGRDEVLTTGPFPTDPQAAVFEAARMVEAHERSEANLADAKAFREQYLSEQPDPPSHRLSFVAATERLRDPVEIRVSREPYDSALEKGPDALDVDIGRGPAGRAFQHARRYAMGAQRALRRARDQNEPATGTLQAARYRHAHRTFRETVDAILAGDISWPEDAAETRRLREDTIAAIETAWDTDPTHLAVELSRHATDVLGHARPRRFRDTADEQRTVDDHDLADFVGTLHYAKRYADGVPDLTRTVVDAITS